MGYLEKEEVATGYHLFRQGEASGCIYFLATGAATAHFELPDGRSIRLRAMRAGTVLGEVGYYQRNVRTASVATTEPSTFYRLSGDSIERMEHDDPDLAVVMHRLIARRKTTIP